MLRQKLQQEFADQVIAVAAIAFAVCCSLGTDSVGTVPCAIFHINQVTHLQQMVCCSGTAQAPLSRMVASLSICLLLFADGACCMPASMMATSQHTLHIYS